MHSGDRPGHTAPSYHPRPARSLSNGSRNIVFESPRASAQRTWPKTEAWSEARPCYCGPFQKSAHSLMMNGRNFANSMSRIARLATRQSFLAQTDDVLLIKDLPRPKLEWKRRLPATFGHASAAMRNYAARLS